MIDFFMFFLRLRLLLDVGKFFSLLFFYKKKCFLFLFTPHPHFSPLSLFLSLLSLSFSLFLFLSFSLFLAPPQVRRYFWKKNLLEEREKKSCGAENALSQPSLFSREEIDSLSFSRVSLCGRFMHEFELFVYGRHFKGQPGYHVLTPFLFRPFSPSCEEKPKEEGLFFCFFVFFCFFCFIKALDVSFSFHQNSFFLLVIFVNRGWIPMEMGKEIKEKKKFPSPSYYISDPVNVHGIFRFYDGENLRFFFLSLWPHLMKISLILDTILFIKITDYISFLFPPPKKKIKQQSIQK